MSTDGDAEEIPIPALWAEHRVDAPIVMISGAKVHVDDRLAGEIPGSEVYDVDTAWIRERFVPADGATHRVRIAWQRGHGKGNLPMLRFELAPSGEPTVPTLANARAAPTDVGEAFRAVTTLARESMQLSERLTVTMQSSLVALAQAQQSAMERDEGRSRAWLEREQMRLAAEAERTAAREERNIQLLTSMMTRGDQSPEGMDELRQKLMEKLNNEGGDMKSLIETMTPLLEMVVGGNGGSKHK